MGWSLRRVTPAWGEQLRSRAHPDSKNGDADRRLRFAQEARTASALNHPNIVTIYGIAEQEGSSFIVMEFVEGMPLSDAIPKRVLKLTEALRVAVQIADALAAAPAAGIIHRDLKPSNIMLDAQGG
jgi:eukaryotic-like serine/threonine-protein kinase